MGFNGFCADDVGLNDGARRTVNAVADTDVNADADAGVAAGFPF